MKNLLEQSGYALVEDAQVWTKAGFGSIAYSDGDEVENRIAAAIAEASDLSILSDALKSQITDWPSLYHLGGGRANILRPFRELLAGADVLEIGAGCGAVTRYLGECGAHVLALEGTVRRATIARSRTRDLPNVEVVADRFDQFDCAHRFDVITLIGVLEYANQFTPGDHPAIAMLARARAMLKPTGKLIIAIENQLGLKYFAGAPEDHLGEPMLGLEARYRHDQPQTYGRKVLAEMLDTAGYQRSDFLSPLPDYKFPLSIVTSHGFACADFDSSAFAAQSARRDPQLPAHLTFSPELVWPVVADNGIAMDLANSFLIVAGTVPEPALDPSVLAYHYSTERARSYCKETIFRRGEDGTIDLQYRSLAGAGEPARSALLQFAYPEQAAYVRGKPMASDLIELVTRDGWTVEQVGAFLQRYLGVLSTFTFYDHPFPVPESVHTKLPGACFDLTPQNLLRDAQGHYHAIDREWVLSDGISVGWLLFRVLLLLAQSVTRLGSTASLFLPTRAGFFQAAIERAGFPVTDHEVSGFAQLEAAAQAEVMHRPPEDLFNWWADSPLPMKNNGHVAMDANTSVALLQAQTESFNSTQKVKSLMQEMEQTAAARQAEVVHLQQKMAERDAHVVALQESLHAMRSSKSWKITVPLRARPAAAIELASKLKLLPQALQVGGGLMPTLRTAFNVLKTEGLDGIRWRLSNVEVLQRTGALLPPKPTATRPSLLITPYYIDPLLDRDPPTARIQARLAVHMHVAPGHDVLEAAQGLNAFRVPYDLYVSIAARQDAASIRSGLKERLASAAHIHVVCVAETTRPMASLLEQLADDLVQYDLVAHFRSGDATKADGLAAFIGPVTGSGGRSVHLLDLLQKDAHLVFWERAATHPPEDGGDRRAKAVLQRHGRLGDEELAQLPMGLMSGLIVRSACLGDLHALARDSAGAEMRATEQELSDAFERLLPLLVFRRSGRILKIQEGDSTDDFRAYEPQRDFSGGLVHTDVKVLSYYLPQFHFTPENDLWHGKDFTEWSKVQAANPLFVGHYQQHIPHPDIGCYKLDTPETLVRQADQMRQAGVHGQVFYHYWFSGRMILEKPAQMLLAHPDIAMPYCFCWANENWTRRWDGNEREILLGQTYSPEDARAFIRYLIPFFQDPRYIRVGPRPMLLVYRPSSIPNPAEYINIWAEECAQAGIDAPYIVAVLTRGATDPSDFGMDAGVERVLHDWTDGAVPDLRPALQAYWPMHGSVLSYDEVRDFYMAQNDRKPFTYFRSNVPMWDNTARYGTQALLLHGSTPQSFQEWMAHSIGDARANLEADRRFVFVNAWNEWAEGTHLEPDTRYGYSYLNSVGRALSAIPYAHERNAGGALPDGLTLHVRFAPDLLQSLRADPLLRRRFFKCLAHSAILRDRGVCADAASFGEELAWIRGAGEARPGDVWVEFRRAIHCAADVVENMARTAWATQSPVIGNDYGPYPASLGMLDNGAVSAVSADRASLVIGPRLQADHVRQAVRMRSDAWCFALPSTMARADWPVVTTIVRFHGKARIEELRSAISCLYTMQDCVVVPLIAAQDLDQAQMAALERMLAEFDWTEGCEPRVEHHASPGGRGDLRARMLHLSLQQVSTRYAAFLDYDDLLFPDAYAWLIQRLRMTGKAVAFGRVYWTDYSSALVAITDRRRAFEYGVSHDDFVRQNHAPLHSVLLDVEQLDRASLVYFDDQRYMEDYLMTLQLFREDNSDWEGLRMNHYVGDYVHSIDRTHTLALGDDAVREALLRDPEYLVCEQRIVDMRRRVTGGHDLHSSP